MSLSVSPLCPDIYECLGFFWGIGAGWGYEMSKIGGMGYGVLILKMMVKCLLVSYVEEVKGGSLREG